MGWDGMQLPGAEAGLRDTLAGVHLPAGVLRARGGAPRRCRCLPCAPYPGCAPFLLGRVALGCPLFEGLLARVEFSGRFCLLGGGSILGVQEPKGDAGLRMHSACMGCYLG